MLKPLFLVFDLLRGRFAVQYRSIGLLIYGIDISAYLLLLWIEQPAEAACGKTVRNNTS